MKPIDAVHGDSRENMDPDEEGVPNAHLIGLNFQRATNLLTISYGLPKDDPRVPA